MMYKRIARPLLFLQDPERVHERMTRLLERTTRSAAGRASLRALYNIDDPRLHVSVAGLHFRNPVGLAAGFDKHCTLVDAIPCLGFGHMEVGTITAHAQPGNVHPRLFRLSKESALINRMGFNNLGAAAARTALRRYRSRKIIVGVNLGKSKRTPLGQAPHDYVQSFKLLAPHADYITINVSSPNTPGLRTLQETKALRAIISAIKKVNRTNVPIFIKIAPDLTLKQIDAIVALIRSEKLAGIIATNTTISREGVRSREEGGLSGKPLRTTSLRIIKYIYKRTKGTVPIIGVGGIFTAEDAYACIRSGASLVQGYTGFVYEGPAFAKRVNKGLLTLMKRDGFATIADAVGVDAG